MLLQEHLRAGNHPDTLLELGVKHRRHGRYPSLVLFKYEIKAPFAEPIVREARGVILDEANNWAVTCRTFDKFFNHGEGHSAEIDWSTARVQEKLDGSLMQMFHHDGAWNVASSGSPDASGLVRQAGVRGATATIDKTFADYFWETFAAEGGELPHAGAERLCFAFELMGPANRVVVVHDKPWLRLLAVRDRETGVEYLPELGEAMVGIPAVRSFPLTSLEEIAASFESISPVSQEGYVVVDDAFRRVKIKHPGYVALHHMKDGMGAKAFVRIAQTGEVPEVLVAFPQFAPMIQDVRDKYTALCTAVDADYAKIKHIEAQKDFAAEALKTPYSGTLFHMRRNGVRADEMLREVAPEKLMGLMGVANDDAPEEEVA